jgi:alanine-synthesizing transaminase
MDHELRRVTGLPDYVFDRIAEWKADAARRGVDIIDFGIGSPDLPASAPVVERMVAAVRDGASHGYPTSSGLPELRAALASWYARRHGVTLDPETQALVTWGASEALTHLPWVLAGPGDSVLVPDPCYPIHHYAVRFTGAEPIPFKVGDGVDVAGAVAEAWDGAVERRQPLPRAILVNFPHNPTARCAGLDDLARLVAFARKHGLVLVNDFAYCDIGFDGYRPPSVLQVPGAEEVAVELVSLSKSHNMAGFRLGFVAGNAEVVGGLRRLKSYLDYGVFDPVQRAAVTALETGDAFAGEMAATYQRRRDLLCDGLTALGWPVPRPRATMFVWAPIPERFRDAGSLAFSQRLFDVAHVAVSPGIGFGESGDGHVRFSLVQDDGHIAAALVGIAAALA